MIRKSSVAFVMVIAAANSAATVEVVTTCQVANDSANVIKVTREHPSNDTHVYKFHYAGKTEYFFDNEQRSRGGPVKLICAGKKERVLVAYGEFTANYLQGFALIYNASTRKIERLDFAEKGPPEWLYLGKTEATVVLPTYGAGENGGRKYVAYRHVKGNKQQPDPESIDVLPSGKGYDAIKLKQ